MNSKNYKYTVFGNFQGIQKIWKLPFMLWELAEKIKVYHGNYTPRHETLTLTCHSNWDENLHTECRSFTGFMLNFTTYKTINIIFNDFVLVSFVNLVSWKRYKNFPDI